MLPSYRQADANAIYHFSLSRTLAITRLTQRYIWSRSSTLHIALKLLLLLLKKCGFFFERSFSHLFVFLLFLPLFLLFSYFTLKFCVFIHQVNLDARKAINIYITCAKMYTKWWLCFTLPLFDSLSQLPSYTLLHLSNITSDLSLLSRRSRQQKRLSASVLPICLSVCLWVCHSVAKMQKTRFSQKLSNLELWCLLMTYRKLYNWAFQRTHYWIPKMQDGWDPPFWKSTWRHFFCRGWSDLDKILETGAE